MLNRAKSKQITLTDVRISNVSLFQNEQGKWILRAFYQVLDEAGSARGSGWMELEPSEKEQGEVSAVVGMLTDAAKAKEGLL